MIPTILDSIHAGHRGADASKRRAREAVYWPSMNAVVQRRIDKCARCNETRPRQQKEPLLPNNLPTRPWQYIAVDLFEFDRQMYLITADSFSGWFEIDHLPDVKAAAFIKKLKMHISRYGIPDKILSDNGPQFANQYFRRFTAEYGIEHKTSSPTYPQSNGYAERAVQRAKSLLHTAKENKEDI